MTTPNQAGNAPAEAAALPADFIPSYPGQSAADKRDALLEQLHCLTAITYGCGGENFRNYSDEIQDGVLWLVHDLVEQVQRANRAASKEVQS